MAASGFKMFTADNSVYAIQLCKDQWFEPGHSGVALLCTNHQTTRAITIWCYKLWYMNVTLTIQQKCYFAKKGL